MAKAKKDAQVEVTGEAPAPISGNKFKVKPMAKAKKDAQVEVTGEAPAPISGNKFDLTPDEIEAKRQAHYAATRNAVEQQSDGEPVGDEIQDEAE